MPYEVDWAAFASLSQEDQAEVARLLSEMDEIAAVNPLRFFVPHPRQHEFLSARQRFKWSLGGNRSGKTTVCTVDDLIQAVDREALPDHLRQYKRWEPPFRWRVIGPDFDLVEMVVMEELKRWVPRSQLVGGGWDKAYDKQHRVLRFQNGSSCQFKTYQQEAWTHGGTALHRVRFDEEPPHDIYNENAMRLVDYRGDCLIAMTPVQGLTWMYDQFWMPYEKGELTNAFVQTVDMDDNPHIDPVAKAHALAGYSAEEREARKTGKFIHFHGLVYGEFQPANVIPETAVPQDMPVYVAIDPGIRHMAAVVFVYHTPDDELVQFAELALQGKNAAEVCKAIHEVCATHEVQPEWYVIDPAARNKEHITGRSLQMEYSDHGVHAFAGQNDIRAGINRMKVRLRPLNTEGEYLEPKLLVMANCQETISQFRKYRWAKPQKTSPNEPKEAPIKKDDHLLDAWRYLVMARPFAPSVRNEAPIDPLMQAVYDDMNPNKDLPALFY